MIYWILDIEFKEQTWFFLTVKSHESTIYSFLLFYFESNWIVPSGVCCWILGLQSPNTKARLDLNRKLIHPQTQCTTNILHARTISALLGTISNHQFLFFSDLDPQTQNQTIIFMNDRQNEPQLGDPGWSKVCRSNWLHNFLVSDHTHQFRLYELCIDLYMAYHKCYRRGKHWPLGMSL